MYTTAFLLVFAIATSISEASLPFSVEKVGGRNKEQESGRP